MQQPVYPPHVKTLLSVITYALIILLLVSRFLVQQEWSLRILAVMFLLFVVGQVYKAVCPWRQHLYKAMWLDLGGIAVGGFICYVVLFLI